MRFVGGPKDGEELYIEPGKHVPLPHDEVTVTSTWFNEDNEKQDTQRHLYRVNAFGQLAHVRRLE